MTWSELAISGLALLACAQTIVVIHLLDCRAEAERKAGVFRASGATRRRLREMRRDLARARVLRSK